HAAHTSESAIDDALRVLLARDTPLSVDAVIALAKASVEIPAPTAVVVEPPDLKEFDALLTLTEENHGQDKIQPSVPGVADLSVANAADGGVPRTDHGTTDRAIAGTASAGVSGSLPEPGRTGSPGELKLPAVPGSADEPRMRSAHPGPHPTPGERVAPAHRQNVGPVPLVALAPGGAATVPCLARRR